MDLRVAVEKLRSFREIDSQFQQLIVESCPTIEKAIGTIDTLPKISFDAKNINRPTNDQFDQFKSLVVFQNQLELIDQLVALPSKLDIDSFSSFLDFKIFTPENLKEYKLINRVYRECRVVVESRVAPELERRMNSGSLTEARAALSLLTRLYPDRVEEFQNTFSQLRIEKFKKQAVESSDDLLVLLDSMKEFRDCADVSVDDRIDVVEKRVLEQAVEFITGNDETDSPFITQLSNRVELDRMLLKSMLMRSVLLRFESPHTSPPVHTQCCVNMFSAIQFIRNLGIEFQGPEIFHIVLPGVDRYYQDGADELSHKRSVAALRDVLDLEDN
jgi:hypothetical protein